jgi:cyclopropane fatty-acyl-phospholipid synthase-like methyltransferase
MTVYLLVFCAALLVAVDIFVIYLVIIGPPYVPTSDEGIGKMLECCEIIPGMKVADLGSGDGRILIALARAGAEAYGYEINPVLVWYSRRKIRRAGLQDKIRVHWKNIWGVDFSPYQVVTLFGITHIMRTLESKLRKELRPGARVVSISFGFPNWPQKKKLDRVFVYEQT